MNQEYDAHDMELHALQTALERATKDADDLRGKAEFYETSLRQCLNSMESAQKIFDHARREIIGRLPKIYSSGDESAKARGQ